MPPLTKELEEIQTDQSAGPPRQTGPCVMVIFGATGDLTARKLFPALYNLAKSNMLSREFAVVGFAKNEYSTDEFRKLMGQNLDNFATEKVDPDLKEWLLKRLYYVSGSFTDRESYQRLAQTLAEVDKNHNTHGNYFFYLATSPVFFADIVDLLGSTGLAVEKDGQWRRIVFEKPFGNDLESARHLNEQIKKTLSEHQIFRIDHYLGKETVQNILVFRFSNGIFEPIWNHRFIDHVQITVAETVGVEKRGGYFDMAGTLRDMVPNHLFQLLSLTTMEPPISFSSDAVHDEQAKILHAVQPLSAEDVLHCAVRGQYGEGEINGERLPAYRSEPGVPPDSKTETFVAMRLVIDNWRWAGVPFYLRTGKRLARRATEVAIQFKRAPFVLFRDTPVNSLKPNQLVIHIAPDEGISLRFGAKRPGAQVRVGSVEMDFNYSDYFGTTPNTGYEILLYDGITGDQTLFQRADMVEAGWTVVDPILDVWKALPPRIFPNYPAGAWGPKEADDIINRDGNYWRKIQ
ncbi:MAG: glucose-6-phosphate dehydrogenase [Candidatus Angelobacter sp. Gp1-AA117]|nr:MAG: glucose-6-phosphate dehydrogenase [Candidatus Angelobacter sp. Gp1-AA117]